MFGDIERSRIIAYTAAFIGLIALGSWISLPLGNIPLTLQTLFILLAGIILHRYGALPVLLYVVLGVLGLPLFHNGTAGIGVLLGPSGGYLIGFIFAALVVGFSYEHTSRLIRIGGIVLGTFVIYLFGVAWLMYSMNLGFVPAVVTGVLPFLPGDAIKAAAACLIGERVA
ncbi:MAG: biotin transporter BioY [Methanomicrobiales archaeon]|nr:biotin transporter BioY [Methanomicrobiales archaeon]